MPPTLIRRARFRTVAMPTGHNVIAYLIFSITRSGGDGVCSLANSRHKSANEWDVRLRKIGMVWLCVSCGAAGGGGWFGVGATSQMSRQTQAPDVQLALSLLVYRHMGNSQEIPAILVINCIAPVNWGRTSKSIDSFAELLNFVCTNAIRHTHTEQSVAPHNPCTCKELSHARNRVIIITRTAHARPHAEAFIHHAYSG